MICWYDVTHILNLCVVTPHPNQNTEYLHNCPKQVNINIKIAIIIFLHTHCNFTIQLQLYVCMLTHHILCTQNSPYIKMVLQIDVMLGQTRQLQENSLIVDKTCRHVPNEPFWARPHNVCNKYCGKGPVFPFQTLTCSSVWRTSFLQQYYNYHPENLLWEEGGVDLLVRSHPRCCSSSEEVLKTQSPNNIGSMLETAQQLPHQGNMKH